MLDETIFKVDAFKTAFFGYNKKMVTDRLYQVQQEYKKLEKQLSSQVEEIETLNKSIQSIEKEKHDLEAQMVEQDILVEDLKNQVKVLQQQAENMRNEVLAYNKANPTNQINPDLVTETPKSNIETAKSTTEKPKLAIKNTDEDDIFVGEIEDNRRTKTDESHMIGNQDDDTEDFEFL